MEVFIEKQIKQVRISMIKLVLIFGRSIDFIGDETGAQKIMIQCTLHI
jgi:hypothetical protein